MFSSQPKKLDLLRFHELNPERYPFLLESVAHGTQQSRFDILFSFPQETLRLTSDGILKGMVSDDDNGFLNNFDSWFKNKASPNNENVLLPFTGGWFVFLAYELVKEIESNLDLPDSDTVSTIAYAVRCPAAIINNHVTGMTTLFAEDTSSELMQDLLDDYEHIAQQNDADVGKALRFSAINEDPAEQYCTAVNKIRQYIINGDVFQVNLSRQWQTTFATDITASDLYRNLRINNPAPFSGLACLPDATIISSSPERLVLVHNKEVQSRPIAGTRPRSGDIEEDQRLSEELLQHPKEQAEHIMLIDLERNDLGRVCVPGSIHVDELMVLESYEHVHHIVSNVTGELRHDTSPADIIRAVFPGGTITGCPKVRCMEIIAELEKTPRGAYTGSMGYINLDGSMDLNILIRTIYKKGNEISLRAGAGIVFDSNAEHELNETRDKAKGMLKALSVNEA